VAYHAMPFRNPHSICVRFLRLPLHSISSWTLISQGLTLAFFTLKTSLRVAY